MEGRTDAYVPEKKALILVQSFPVHFLALLRTVDNASALGAFIRDLISGSGRVFIMLKVPVSR